MITHEDVRKMFTYRPTDGELIRNYTARFNAVEGSVAGAINGQGYRQVEIAGKQYQNHRLVWFYHFGYFPENELDHINRNRSDNRIENLREVSKSCNLRNSKSRKNSSGGIKGVTWVTLQKRWAAQIQSNNVKYFLGYSKCVVEAACLRLAAEQCLNWSTCEQTSSAFTFVQAHIKKIKGATT